MRRLISEIVRRRIVGGKAGSGKPARMYTTQEVANLTNTCTRTVARDVAEGRLEVIRFNRRRLRYTEDAVRRYLTGEYPDAARVKARLSAEQKPVLKAESGPDGNNRVDGAINKDAKALNETATHCSADTKEKVPIQKRKGRIIEFFSNRAVPPSFVALLRSSSGFWRVMPVMTNPTFLAACCSIFAGRYGQNRRYTLTQNALN